jgi:hypothetical protein
MLKYLQIYCFDTCKPLPIYHIFDEANTFTPIYFSNKYKCLDFHKFNIFFSNLTPVGCNIITNFKMNNVCTFYKIIPNILLSFLSFHAPYNKPLVLCLFNLEPNALPNNKFVNMCSCYKQCSYTCINI